MKKKIIPLLCASLLMVGASVQAVALDYNFESNVQGDTWYQTTAAEAQYIENSDNIIVGSDGTIVIDGAGLVSAGPLSVVEVPAGEYPDAWGKTTDIAIAQNSVFPNVLSPTTQMTGVVGPAIYQPGVIASGALPTGAQTIWGYTFASPAADNYMPKRLST